MITQPTPRRDFIRKSALFGGAAVFGGSVLSACGDDDAPAIGSATTSTSTALATGPMRGGTMSHAAVAVFPGP